MFIRKNRLRKDLPAIDIRKKPKSFEEFLKILQEEGYEYKAGK